MSSCTTTYALMGFLSWSWAGPRYLRNWVRFVILMFPDPACPFAECVQPAAVLGIGFRIGNWLQNWLSLEAWTLILLDILASICRFSFLAALASFPPSNAI